MALAERAVIVMMIVGILNFLTELLDIYYERRKALGVEAQNEMLKEELEYERTKSETNLKPA